MPARLGEAAELGEGGAELVTYTTASGGAVFSAGSCTWTSCVLVDAAVSRMTRNVLERFLRR